ncbi:TetR/AcrR family transcriptional regulator [Mycolicibacter arupensis]|uniref:TetR/AcrR family transcriptional regulator n=1 Tax=Mycolicibacter arupensis TaxID=342002 RepID=UPI003B3B2C94
MSASIKAYHHGDLPGTLLRAAMDLLEENGATELSLRAAARRAGVSTAAPYRHFADRNALLSEIAAVGYHELAAELIAAHPSPTTAEDFAALAVAYVQFAVNRPGLFRVMFTEQCDPTNAERAAAVTAIQEYLNSIVQQVFPSSNPEAMALAVWGLVHGLAFLHLDGKLDTSSKQAIAERVREAVLAAAGRLS